MDQGCSTEFCKRLNLYIFFSVFCFLFSVFLAEDVSANATFSVIEPKCEYKVNPLGLDISAPRFSWRISTDQRGWLQTAYQIRVAASPAELTAGKGLVWDSGKTVSDTSIHRVYAGPALQSGKRYYWQVRSWDNQGDASEWSAVCWWEMGLLNDNEWQASWIQAELSKAETESGAVPLLRKEFEIKGGIESARIYVTSLGLYELFLNGRRVGEQLLTPGWTAYEKRLQYQTYDVTRQLHEGTNAVGMMIADGWYRGRISGKSYEDKTAALLQLQVVLKDGSRLLVVTDSTWEYTSGPILMSDIYNGETYDARLEKKDWTRSGFNAAGWKGVKVIDHPKSILTAPAGPEVRRIEEIKPVKMFKTPTGLTVVDMGQNMVGWIRLQVSGPSGSKVTLRHAEVLDKDGNFYVANLRTAKQTIEYTLKGEGIEVYEPHFTFQGFRYFAVDSFPGEPTLDAFAGVVVHSNIPRTGSFECSDPMINQLQHNILWGLKGNFVDVPTDCPQRDERLGWTGDAQVFARTACFNADVASFYTKWLQDLSADQKENGAVPHVIPNVLDRRIPTGNVASAGWADAAVIVPWTVYLSYGDTRILEKQYDSMKKWVEYMSHRAGETHFWNTDFTYGDWLAFATTRSDYPGATTDKDMISQAFFGWSTNLLLKTAVVLGKTEDAARYATLLGKIKKVFLEEFVTPNGRLSSNTQTAYALALGFDLLPEKLKASAAKRLAADVRTFEHITTGFLGTPLICQVLTDYGYEEEAFLLLNRKEYPSWLYPITKGATTIWERWDGIKPNGTFQDEGMNSFNHYAYGAIGEWLYRFVAGVEIDTQKPGYKHSLLQPHPGGKLEYAKASVQSMFGKVASGWRQKDGKITVSVEIPPNTTATIRLPNAKIDQVKESGEPLNAVNGILSSSQKDKVVMIEAGSGKYEFVYSDK